MSTPGAGKIKGNFRNSPNAHALETRVVPIESAEVRVVPHDWIFARTFASEIDAHWQSRTVGQPNLFNGEIYLLRHWTLHGAAFVGEIFKTDFKNFLYWRECGAPDGSVFDFFAAAALYSREDCLIVGRMSVHTSSRGSIYPPCGSLDAVDIEGKRIDLERNIARETREETGLSLKRLEMGPPVMIFDGPRIVYLRPFKFDRSASALQNRITEHIGRQAEPELAEIMVVKGVSDIDQSAMPPFVAAYIRYAFGS